MTHSREDGIVYGEEVPTLSLSLFLALMRFVYFAYTHPNTSTIFFTYTYSVHCYTEEMTTYVGGGGRILQNSVTVGPEGPLTPYDTFTRSILFLF